MVYRKLKYDNDNNILIDNVIFVPSDVAQVYHNSKRAQEEFSHNEPSFRRAVSLGRRLIDPLTEIVGLANQDNEILYLPLDPLSNMVNQELLRTRLDRQIIDIVNEVGVNLNSAIRYTWKRPLLEFVSGLGPRKAKYLTAMVKRHFGHVYQRSVLKDIL